MGRITVFTTADDLNSKRVLKELERRHLPYTEIDLEAHPARVIALSSALDAPSVPHVFFNTRYVGGVENCVQELKRWDKSARYRSALHKYNAEIASCVDPAKDYLSLPDPSDAVAQEPAKACKARIPIEMPDGSSMYVRELNENMKEWVTMECCKYKGVVYKRSCTGRTLASSLQTCWEMSLADAVRFAERLTKEGIVQHVDTKTYPVGLKSSFRNTSQDVYRIQCDAKPDVLNSYLTWQAETTTGCLEMVSNLHKLLTVMEMSSVDPEDGLLNAEHAVHLKKFAKFEEAVCELQKLPKQAIETLNENEMTAFALNLYIVMMRYAYLKIGVPTSDADRNHLLNNIKFIMSGETYSLQDWVDILTFRTGFMGCSTTSLSCSDESSSSDHISVKHDKRILFALFTGIHGGSRWSTPFSLYTPKHLERELDIAAQVFCLEDRNVRVDREQNEVSLLTSVFKTYRCEFGGKDNVSILKSLLPYVRAKKRTDLISMIGGQKASRVTYVEPELGMHTVAGPWYRKSVTSTGGGSPNRRFMGVKGIKVGGRKERSNSIGSSGLSSHNSGR